MTSDGQIVCVFALYLVVLFILTLIYIFTDVKFSETVERDILMHFNDTVRLLMRRQ